VYLERVVRDTYGFAISLAPVMSSDGTLSGRFPYTTDTRQKLDVPHVCMPLEYFKDGKLAVVDAALPPTDQRKG